MCPRVVGGQLSLPTAFVRASRERELKRDGFKYGRVARYAEMEELGSWRKDGENFNARP